MRRYIGTPYDVRNNRLYRVTHGNPNSLKEEVIHDSSLRKAVDDLRPHISQRIGVFCYGDIVIEILPKGALPTNKAPIELKVGSLYRAWTAIARELETHCLGAGRKLTVRTNGPTPGSAILDNNGNEYEDVLEYFLVESLRIVDETLARRRPVTYQDLESEEIFIRGRVNWAQQGSRMHGLKHRHHLEFQEYDAEVRLVEFIKCAVLAVERAFDGIWESDAPSRTLISSIKHRLEPVPTRANVSNFRTLVTGFIFRPEGRFAFLAPAVTELAKWVYGLHIPASETGIHNYFEYSLTGFRINIARLFEQWCRTKVKEALSDLNYESNDESPEIWYWGEPPIELQPDIVVYEVAADRTTEVVHAIIDAKYKLQDTAPPPTEHAQEDAPELDRPGLEDGLGDKSFVVGLVRADLYQLTTYMNAVASDATKVKRKRSHAALRLPDNRKQAKGALILCSDSDQELRSFSGGGADTTTHFSVGVRFGEFIIDKGIDEPVLDKKAVQSSDKSIMNLIQRMLNLPS
jgi:hypothetical protein